MIVTQEIVEELATSRYTVGKVLFRGKARLNLYPVKKATNVF